MAYPQGMNAERGVWEPLLDAVRRYPSPHNSQPIRVRIVDELVAHVFYDLDRGLPAENFGIPFGHVCAGVFLESLAVVAAAEGYEVREDLQLSEMDFDAVDRLHPIATVTLVPQEVTAAAVARRAVFDRRRTNRRPYDSRVVPDADLEVVRAIAAAGGQDFRWNNDRDVVAHIIEVNQETLFDDLRNDAVHAEILEWLRFSERHARTAGDGLSARTMLMPGSALKFAMKSRSLWDAPVIGALMRWVYVRTMRGVRQIAWFEGPFAGPSDFLESGRLFMRSWLELAARGVALHPLGTVITNPRSHRRFVEAAGINETGDRMAWMLVRLGYAKEPPAAHRRGLDEMVVP